LRISFEIADRFFKEFLKNSHGLVSKDAKRRADNQKRGSQPFDKGRAPITAGAGLDQMLGEFNWTSKLEKATLFTQWEKIVGPESAEASYPEDLERNVLTVRCRSTAWATQLRLLQAEILAKVNQNHPDLEIGEVRFIGPAAPSWKKGPRSVPGRGPRDTYG
jgi:predicted nucleic acid-binding Zn ribbon protein